MILWAAVALAQVSFADATAFPEDRTLREMGLSIEELAKCRDEVSACVYWNEGLDQLDDAAPSSSQRLSALARQLRLIADGYVRDNFEAPRPLLRKWLFCQSVCAYVCSHLQYDFGAAQRPISVRNREAEADAVLSQPREGRKTMCVGFVLLARDLIRQGGADLGIGAFFVGSFWRDLGGEATATSNHAFLAIQLDKDIIVPAEPTTARMSLKDFKARCTAPRFDYVMPIAKPQRELFWAMNYGADETPTNATNHGDRQNWLPFTTLGLARWKQAETTFLKPRATEQTRDFDRRAKWLPVN